MELLTMTEAELERARTLQRVCDGYLTQIEAGRTARNFWPAGAPFDGSVPIRRPGGRAVQASGKAAE